MFSLFHPHVFGIRVYDLSAVVVVPTYVYAARICFVPDPRGLATRLLAKQILLWFFVSHTCHKNDFL